MVSIFKNNYWIPFSFIIIFLMTVYLRPLLPIDETRYLSVAWEMFLRNDWLAPLTVNGAPYHHKPPLLFWLINAMWALTGPSRWSATIPPIMMGMASVFLTIKLAAKIFPDNVQITRRAPVIMMGCLPFLIYSSMVMFDVTMMLFVLLTFLNMLAFAHTQKSRYVIFMALMLGLGVLTKGPVAYLYVIFPMVLGPLWHQQPVSTRTWYGGILSALLLSMLPVLLWLVPVLKQSDSHFAFWLVWEQTAGRVTGNFGAAHARPFYFYLPIAAILMLPWILFPSFWRQARQLKNKVRADHGLRFLLCWLAPVFVSFSIISGKQPHYLVPLIPGMALLIAVLLDDVKIEILQKTTLFLFGVLIVCYGVGAGTFFKNYDLMPVANYVAAHSDQDWAFVKQYHGQLTFLARMQKPMDVEQLDTIDAWFDAHPSGYAIISFNDLNTLKNLSLIMETPYRGKKLGIFRKGGSVNQVRLKAEARRSLGEGEQSVFLLLYAYLLESSKPIAAGY